MIDQEEMEQIDHRNQKKESLVSSLLSSQEERAALLEHVTEIEDVFDISRDPYNYMLKVIFSRWKPFLLRAIAIDDGTYFSRFFKQLPISQKVLSQNLKEMQADQLVYREVIPEIPPRVVYHLTPKGESLIPILDLIYDWGWNDMRHNGLPVDILGEMWHGYRDPDPQLMNGPFYSGKFE